MSQHEIFDWLRSRRLAGDHAFYTRKEIEAACRANGTGGLRVRAQLDALYVYRFLEVRVADRFSRRYRLRAKYLKEGLRE